MRELVLPLVDDLVGDVRNRRCCLVLPLVLLGGGEGQVLHDPVADALLNYPLARAVGALLVAVLHAPASQTAKAANAGYPSSG